jgi:hypothetical protein
MFKCPQNRWKVSVYAVGQYVCIKVTRMRSKMLLKLPNISRLSAQLSSTRQTRTDGKRGRHYEVVSCIFYNFIVPNAPKNALHCTERQRSCKKWPQPLDTGPHIRAFQVMIHAMTGPWRLTQCWTLLTIDDLRHAGTGPYWVVLPFLTTTSYSSFFHFPSHTKTVRR